MRYAKGIYTVIYLAFFAGIVIGATGFMVAIMIGVPDDPKPTPRLSTIINTALMNKDSNSG